MCRGSGDIHYPKPLLLPTQSTISSGTEMPPSVTVPSDAGKTSAEQDDNTADVPVQESASMASSGNKIILKPVLPDATSNVVIVPDSGDDKDLQKAIALSIQEHQQQFSKPGGDSGADAGIDDASAMIVSAEDREVSRALEESLKDVPSVCVKKKSNPLERKREAGMSLGLINIGNSCWFNVVSQPLFYLPAFRNMIINFRCMEQNGNCKKMSQPKICVALSKLFALMLGSEQRYVAPTECVRLFQGGEVEMRRSEQEDVCEIIHKLLERLELEFNDVLREEGEEKESSGLTKDAQFRNPIMKLFYGQYKKESMNSINADDDCDNKRETFGQYPLHVLKYGDIHDSILASMSGRRPNTQKAHVSGSCEDEVKNEEVSQDCWFKLLPPVLIFSLSRYEFSQATQRAEKVHNKFEFSELLYMDRYMECNKALVRQKHIQVAAIKKQLLQLRTALRQYQEYGAGDSKLNLTDVLTYAKQFASTSDVVETTTGNTPASHACESEPEMQDEATEGKEVDEHKRNAFDVAFDAIDVIVDESSKPYDVEGMEVDCTSDVSEECDSLTVIYGSPKASAVSLHEFELIRACLSRWEQQVRKTESELCNHITKLEKMLKTMYDEPELLKIAYRLHAVIVHEGQASAGHYWVYIRHRDEWWKYNDVQVTKSSWDELQQDSLGGLNNASAYCLMYTDTNRHDLLYPIDDVSYINIQDALQALPLHLQDYVKQDNLNFQEEIIQWKCKSNLATSSSVTVSQQVQQAYTDTVMPPPTAPNSPSSCIANPPQADKFDTVYFLSIKTVMVEGMTSRLIRAIEQHQATCEAIERVARQQDSASGSNLPPAVCTSLKPEIVYKILTSSIEEIKRTFKECSPSQLHLTAVLDFGLFLEAFQACHPLKLHAVLLLHQIAIECADNSPVVDVTVNSCSTIVNDMLAKTPALSDVYKFWQCKYKLLLDTVWHLLCGFDAFIHENYLQAMPLFIKSYHLYRDFAIVRSGDEVNFANNFTKLRILEEAVFVECRCKCLLALNSLLIKNFLDSGNREAAEEVFHSVTGLLVPSLIDLSSEGKECEAADTVRRQWCGLLEKKLSPHCAELCEQVLDYVLSADSARSSDDSSTCRVRISMPVTIKQMPQVKRLVKEYSQLLNKMGLTNLQ